MKKLISLITLAALALSLTACGKFKCEVCQQEKTGEKHTIEGHAVCNDCYSLFSSMGGL